MAETSTESNIERNADVQFNILGPMTAVVGSEAAALGGPKQRTVLAMLIAHAGQPLRSDTIEMAVYGDNPPKKANRVVQTYVSSLRSTFGDHITRHRTGWTLSVDRSSIDAHRLEDLQLAVRQLPPDKAAAELRQALSLWRDRPYVDVEAHGLLDAEISRLSELHVQVLRRLIDAELAAGRHGELIGEIEGILAEYPFHEAFRAQHMLALYRAGRQREALGSYQRLRQLLIEQLGADPSPELQRLENRILQHDPALLSIAPSPTNVAAARPYRSNLPIPPTPLLGRAVEIERLQTLMDESRLVTVTGVGGCGKTRLAIEVATRLQFARQWDSYFVDVSSISRSENLLPAILESVGINDWADDPTERLTTYLSDKQAVLVLDGCEHMVEACAELVTALLGRLGTCRILLTSREFLAVAGEQLYSVPPLETTGDEAAIHLYEARARALNPDFALDRGLRADVARLCDRLDGLPLAIELAAGRSLVMSPAELLARLDGETGVLGSAGAKVGNRHHSLAATLDWSYSLLDGKEQGFLNILGVFRGHFDVAAVAAVADIDTATTTDLLQALVSKSLVVSGSTGTSTAFRLLDTVRSFAEHHLEADGGLESARIRHLDYYLNSVVDAVREQWSFLRPNIEAAIDSALDGSRLVDAVNLFTASEPLWHEQDSLTTTLSRLDALFAQLDSPPYSNRPDRGALLERLSVPEMQLALGLHDIPRLLSASRAAMDASDEDVRFVGLIFQANALTITDPDTALKLADKAAESHPLDGCQAVNKIRADVAMFAGRYQEAIDIWQRFSLVTWDAPTVSMAALLLLDGRPQEALDLAEGYDPVWSEVAQSLTLVRGLAHLEVGDRAQAEKVFLDEATAASDGREVLVANAALIGLAALALDDGDRPKAAEIMLEVGRTRTLTGSAVAQMVATRAGVGEQYTRRLHETSLGTRHDATDYLRSVLPSVKV
jgi:predicted ATPase/DNA-binding SARP family transcriptional activator